MLMSGLLPSKYVPTLVLLLKTLILMYFFIYSIKIDGESLKN